MDVTCNLLSFLFFYLAPISGPPFGPLLFSNTIAGRRQRRQRCSAQGVCHCCLDCFCHKSGLPFINFLSQNNSNVFGENLVREVSSDDSLSRSETPDRDFFICFIFLFFFGEINGQSIELMIKWRFCLQIAKVAADCEFHQSEGCDRKAGPPVGVPLIQI